MQSTSERILSAVRQNWLLNIVGLLLSFGAFIVLVRAMTASLYAEYGVVLAKNADERDAIGTFLRAQVERLHSLPRLAGRILDELAGSLSRR